MHFTGFVTFSELTWKFRTAEDKEILYAEVCDCCWSKKIHFLAHDKKKTKTKTKPHKHHFLAHSKKTKQNKKESLPC